MFGDLVWRDKVHFYLKFQVLDRICFLLGFELSLDQINDLIPIKEEPYLPSLK